MFTTGRQLCNTRTKPTRRTPSFDLRSAARRVGFPRPHHTTPPSARTLPTPPPPVDSPTLFIDEFGPLPVRRPAAVAEVGALVTEAVRSNQGLYPVGGRTKLDIGLPPVKQGFALDTTALNRVIDYPARDMTITAQAGVTLAEVQAMLAKEGQWLPIDVPHPEKATLGGSIALNVSGPRRLGYGTLRDYVIGISFVTDDGAEVKAGGRVVKNVAGYDLMKLQIGAVGTLGVVTQVTLKVKPRPEASAVVTLGCGANDLPAVLDLLHASPARPVVVELLNTSAWRATGANATPPAEWVLVVAFEEKAVTVGWQLDTLLAELKAAPVSVLSQDRGDGPAKAIDEMIAAAVGRLSDGLHTRFWFKASVPPSRTAAFCVAAAGRHADLQLYTEAMNGIVHGHVAPGLTLEEAVGMTAELARLAAEGGGSLSVRRCPPSWKTELPVWGEPRGDRNLMRHLKRTLDPNTVFNPGRLFGDI